MSADVKEEQIDHLRTAPALYRQVLLALCNGAQMVLRYGQWEGYSEERGKVQPLGLYMSEAAMHELARSVDDCLRAVIHGDPAFVYMPAAKRDYVRDLLTLSMPTQHLKVRQADTTVEPAAPRRERQAA